ncbi:hypothetical protein Lal_00019268 [Lupinus albus]|uniref:Putative transcription factor STY-LRP1 family n=1 Tax=Lupinus albus TaxID=3870 RepID=A0A6A4R2N9_LUPAL|nr:putative transcription factor STY-LRP1 family [Lupinus albus]KAF1899146.1 hypothetical protein Lal_00019268 [Lupinus albus]
MSRTRGEEEIMKGSLKCEDCGNQAKKDCAYSRCRTCCKNKDFECQTHLRSTWIPVDRRRQRVSSTTPTPNPNHLHGGSDDPKRYKHNSYSGLEEFKFPASMSSMAVFNCVRVQSMDDTVKEIAYQTSINIGGRVFSGLLYDQGPDQQSFNGARGQRSTNSLHQQHNNLNLVSSEIHDGATMAQPSAAAATAYHQPFFPPPHVFPFSDSFKPGLP